MVKILEGLRIVEGSAFVAAPLAGMTLAQMGADVIRFDRIRGGLDARRWPVTENGRSLFWAGLNKGKRSLAVDMSTPRGQEIVTRLICAPGEGNGIFLTNLRVRGWMDYDSLRRSTVNDLIMMSVTGDRSGGPQVDYTVNPAMSAFQIRQRDRKDPSDPVRPRAARVGLYHGPAGCARHSRRRASPSA